MQPKTHQILPLTAFDLLPRICRRDSLTPTLLANSEVGFKTVCPANAVEAHAVAAAIALYPNSSRHQQKLKRKEEEEEEEEEFRGNERTKERAFEVGVEVERPRETYLKKQRERMMPRIGQKSYPPIGNRNELQPQI
jgi:hypothetical protein